MRLVDTKWAKRGPKPAHLAQLEIEKKKTEWNTPNEFHPGSDFWWLMRPIRLPEPPSGFSGLPEIFDAGGVYGAIKRAIIIGNGFAGSENQSIGLVRALGLSRHHSLYVSHFSLIPILCINSFLIFFKDTTYIVEEILLELVWRKS